MKATKINLLITAIIIFSIPIYSQVSPENKKDELNITDNQKDQEKKNEKQAEDNKDNKDKFVEELKKDIEKQKDNNEDKKEKWEPGENPFENLSPEELQKKFGYVPKAVNFPTAPELDDDTVVPSTLDWRDFENRSFVTKPKDQGSCGSCWAFAMTAGLESYILRNGHKDFPNLWERLKNKGYEDNIDFSEQAMLSCSGAGTCNGGAVNPEYIKFNGLPFESQFPYEGKDSPCRVSGGTSYKIYDIGSVPKNIEKIKKALFKYGPLPTTMIVYQDFLYYKSGVYYHIKGEQVSAHAVLLVGYNDYGRYFIVKNSWGEKWGEKGYFRISYSEVNSSVNFGEATVAYVHPKRKKPDTKVDAVTLDNQDDKVSEKLVPVFRPALDWLSGF